MLKRLLVVFGLTVLLCVFFADFECGSQTKEEPSTRCRERSERSHADTLDRIMNQCFDASEIFTDADGREWRPRVVERLPATATAPVFYWETRDYPKRESGAK